MIEFDDENIQKKFISCHFRQEYDGVDICRCMCGPCVRVIEWGECDMLKDYFSKEKGGEDDGEEDPAENDV